MTYLVTGATGGFGHYALNELKKLVPLEEIYVLARSKEKAEQLIEEGIEVRIGDYADPETMVQALKGIDRLLFVSGVPGNRQAEHQHVVEAAKEAGVSFIAYTSFADADHSTSILAPDHQFTEKIIKESGIKHTFLRNNWYLENEMPLIDLALKTGQFVYAAGEGKTGWALKREYAEVAAKVLAGTDYPEVLELSGKPITYQMLAEKVAKVSGKSIEILSLDTDGFIGKLTDAGFSQGGAEMTAAIQNDIRNNQLDVISDDFEKVLGRELTSLEDGLKELGI
ncbi:MULTISPECIES: SDR family oxidoreductase [unclassified Enterococcus]|uniref:SDR family oxidoreductase n=1 Tax=unclassified Enterococcus TaxID=2608891 RepID=UPI001A923019|nr:MULTISPECIES: SDR family oxidoreductase [unclassified Enterococcus]MBO0461692.1 SDR family oxidoreductase [Enterococcus sp. DIV1298c]MBO1298980.1 SDR family oxidoreductase [Enterococcus sp. DIV1271a]